jgi:hypothetical protein
MRTVTGAIGRINRDRYQISTPTATVGIRGTGGVIQVLNDGSTLVVGTSGIWSLTNPAGSIDVPAGISGLAPADPTTPPQQTSQAPQSGPAPLPPQPLFAQGEQRDTTGGALGIPIPTPAPTFTPLVSGPGYTAALAYSVYNLAGSAFLDGGEGAAFSGPPTGNAIFNSTGQLTELNNFAADSFGFSGRNYKLEPGGSHGLRADGTADFGSDGVLAWGRWVGTVSGTEFPVNETFGPNEGLHYVIGMPTPVLPTAGSATYSLLGATSPTYVGGLTAPGQVTSGALSVTWGATSYGIALQNFVVSMPAGASTPAASYALDGSTTISLTGSFWSLFMFGTGSVTPSGGATCASTCSASAEGFFAGANAERAGMSYRINDFNGVTSKNIIGAAAFKKNP